MIDCINEECLVDEEADETCEDVSTTCTSEMDESPVKPITRGRKQRAIRTKLACSTPPSLQSSPSKQQPQQHSTSLLEYVVDQKGIGSDSLVVKSASMLNSSSASSRRNSFSNLSQRKPTNSINQNNNAFSPFNPKNSAPTTTQSHHLFPNYPRALPSLETQFDFNFANGTELGLTALNVNDFNLLGFWNNNNNTTASIASNNNASYLNIYPQSDIPRYTLSSHSHLNHNNAIPSSTSQNPINNLVSDLFGDIANMF